MVGDVGPEDDDGVALELVQADPPFRRSSNSFSRISSSDSLDVSSLNSCNRQMIFSTVYSHGMYNLSRDERNT